MGHAIIMRHPFRWHRIGVDQNHILFVWLDAWANTLEQLLNNKVDGFAIVNYEMLLLAQDEISQEIPVTIRNSCISQMNKTQVVNQRRRRLEFHENISTTTSNYLNLTWNEELTWNMCVKDEQCRSCMDELAPLISEFGYSFNQSNLFKPEIFEYSSSKFLYSSSNLPSKKLVKQMKSLAEKYIEHQKLSQSE